MKKSTRMEKQFEGSVMGLDVGDRSSAYFVVDKSGRVESEGSIKTTEQGLAEVLQNRAHLRVVLEVGTHSPWISRLLGSWGHEVIVANPHRLRMITQSVRKNDRSDAETLARVGRLDIGMLTPVHHRSAQAQIDLAVVRARASLVSIRTRLVNEVRAVVKSCGGKRLPSCSVEAFARMATPSIPEALLPALKPLTDAIAELTTQIQKYDRTMEQMASERYPAARHLQQVPGVGPVTALSFVLTIEKPERFERSRNVGAYLGLVPRQRESGERAPELGITKRGDRALRSLLVQCAHYILGHHGPDSALRRWGLERCPPGARSQKKRTVVAVARKLAVLLHRLWVTGEVYVPLREEPAVAA
jgi:transposase